jgi:4-amino-4-deoxy-L-arabinose transferase-like glycosyltransferase
MTRGLRTARFNLVRALLLLGAVSVLGLFVGLQSTGFSDDREARDAAVAREVWWRRELIRPMLGGEPELAKPWLGYMPELAGAAWTGHSPVGSRAIRAGAAVLLVLGTGWLGARHLGRRAGWAGAAALASSLAVPLAVRSDGLIVIATLLGWLAAWLFADVLLRGYSPWRVSLAYLLLATTLMMAGPLPALWPLGGLVLGLWWAHAPSLWRRLHPIAGLLVMIGLALPWYGAMTYLLGGEFLVRALGFPYADPSAGHWYAFPARALGFLVVGFFPWSTLLPEAALRAVRWPPPIDLIALLTPGERPSAPPALTLEPLLLGWLVVAAVAMPVPPAAPLSAALPALPAAALLVGRALARVFDRDAAWSRAAVQAALLMGVTGTAGAVLMAMVSPRLTTAAPALRLAATFLLVSSWAPFAATLLRQPAVAAALMALPVALGTPLVFARTLPALEEYLDTRVAAEAFHATAPAGTPLLVVGMPPASLRLRVREHLVEPLDLPQALREQRGTDGYAYVAFPAARESEVARAASPAPIEVLIRAPSMGLARVQELR